MYLLENYRALAATILYCFGFEISGQALRGMSASQPDDCLKA